MIKAVVTVAVLSLLVCYINYRNPNLLQSFYHQHFGVPKTWGKIEMIEEKLSLKEILMNPEWLYQMAEHVFGFTVGILVCLGIGWKASNFYTQIGKAYEKKLEEVVKKQTKFENKLGELDNQINTFELTFIKQTMKLLYSRDNKKKTVDTKDAYQQMEVSENFDKGIQTSQSAYSFAIQEHKLKQNAEELKLEKEKLEKIMKKKTKEYEKEFRRIVGKCEERFNQNIEETNCEPRPLQTPSKDVFSKSDTVTEVKNSVQADDLSKTNDISNTEVNPVETDPHCLSTQDVLSSDIIEENNTVNTEGYSEEVSADEETDCLNTDDNEDNYPSESAYSYVKIKEGSNDEMQTASGGGESDETFRGKIVSVSQIPHYQGLRKSQDKAKSYIDKDNVPFITNNIKTNERIGPERATTPHSTPRKHTVYAEGNSTPRKQNVTSPDRAEESPQKTRRRKQRC